MFTISTVLQLCAQGNASKTIKKTFPFTNAKTFFIHNKHGAININGWSQDKIQIHTQIIVTKSKKAEAQELLTRIEPILSIQDNDNITAQYSIKEKSTSMLSKLLGHMSTSEGNKGNIQVNYTVYLPENATVDITNKFGDIVINDWSGKLNVDAQHGNLWVNTDLTNANIAMKFGKVKAKTITYGSFTLKNSELELQAAKNLQIKSTGSTITLDAIVKLNLSSSKDKIIANTIHTIDGKLKFSNITIAQVKEQINLMMDVVDCSINTISKKDATIAIQQKSSEIHLNIKNLSFDFKAELEQGVLRIPTTFKNIQTNVIDNRKKLRTITASYGIGPKGTFSITGKKGIILLQER